MKGTKMDTCQLYSPDPLIVLQIFSGVHESRNEGKRMIPTGVDSKKRYETPVLDPI